ncbi:MAG TPA: hypothetical protein VFN10_23365 [Thermoanaerobaculia bacterium]|nr:hypothetical protein [Thermoanaerobaculia bacterium]
MKRGVIDTLRRALDSVLANWPLLLLRAAEVFLALVVVVGGVLVLAVQLLVSLGISFRDMPTPESMQEAMVMLAQRWTLAIYSLLIVFGIALVLMVLHSFVQAGCARVYADAERIAGDGVTGPRQRFAVFSMDRFLAGAKSGWWTVFWIYNLGWGAASIVLLVPLLPTIVAMLVFHDAPQAALIAGCLGVVVTLFLFLLVAVVASVWTTRAITSWAARALNARAALSDAWAALRGDLARHVVIALALFVVSIAGSSFFASFSLFAGLGEAVGRHAGPVMFFTFPLRIVGSLLNAAFSAGMNAWFLAAYAALAVESTQPRA